QRPVECRHEIIVTAQHLIGTGYLVKDKNITRINLESSVHIAQVVLPPAWPPVDPAEGREDQRFVREQTASNLQFGASPVVIAITVIVQQPRSQMRFAPVWAQPNCGLHRCSCPGQSQRS